MDALRAALAGQYRAGLAMLRQCVETCPEDLWSAGEHPRTFWRIAYHALFFTHYYLSPSKEEFEAWEHHQDQATVLWDDDEAGLPPREVTFSQVQLLSYLDEIYSSVDSLLDALDLASQESGFPWYKISKLDHQLLNVRHLGVHVGQLQERCFARGIELDWVSKKEGQGFMLEWGRHERNHSRN